MFIDSFHTEALLLSL